MISKTSNHPVDLFSNLNLQKHPLLANDNAYKKRQETLWSAYSRVEPACILRPTTASEVSTIVKTLAASGQKFAIRSGGHHFDGANNIQNGVTVDLQFLNWVKFDEKTAYVEIGPGACWKDVYIELEKYGRVVAGANHGKVGVGGLLLGGGKTFFAGSRGLAFDDVVSCEVVLGDGRVITADATNSQKDLFLALKGGSSNFGVVTNFWMETIVCDRVWGGFRILSENRVGDALRAFGDFANRVPEEVDSSSSVIITYMPDQKDVVVIQALAQVGAVENAPAYKKMVSIPAIKDSCKMTTINNLVSEHDPIPSGYYNCYYTLTIKNDIRIFQKAADVHNQVVQDLKAAVPDGNFLTECTFQPFSKCIGKRSAERGGNITGISSQPEDGVMWVALIAVKTAEQEKVAHPMLQKWGEAVRDYASSIEGGLLPWVYLNYADVTQKPLASYGAENVKKMRDVAAKYDPKEVFQKLCPGGFKISDVAI